ncbi:MAG: hypothetical protein RLZZ437_23 [Pseudomonadota bacterium]|jgi:type VI secretion system secreted protein VgrG
MNGLFKQATRQGRLVTVLGADVLSLLRFDGAEHLNDLFAWRIDALAARDDLDFDALLGTHATVMLGSFDLPEVAFDGIVAEAQMLGAGENGWRYELILRPWLWLLSLRRKQQIFHNKTVADILTEVFAPYGEVFELRLSGSYPVLEYTVQYRETDLAFATRMMERFGISYHFVHKAGVHTLILTDNITVHDAIPGSTRKLLGVTVAHRADEEHFTAIIPVRRITTGAIRLTDYNFKTPTAAMEVDHLAAVDHAHGQIESYDYPGDYLAQAAGKRVARLGADRARGQDARHHATGDCASLRAGGRVTAVGDGVPGVGGSVCLTARHRFQSNAYGSGGSGADSAPIYEGSYVLMPDTSPMRPELKTPRALVQGPQTAVVVGEGEIDCDEYGRILVRFHWDLDARHSMRCRVSQNWAGKGWGGMVIPRIGMEVVVEFLEGDPDKPLVTGCVYNGKNDVPYPLPDHKTKSVFRSDSHRSGGFNELTFEDATGAENISLHAQKDMTLKVLNNHAKRVENDDVESIGNNKSIEIGNNYQVKYGGSYNQSVGSASNGALFSALGGLLGGAAAKMAEGASEVGNAAITSFVGGLAASSVAAEAVSLGGNAAFTAAGQHRQIAGLAQTGAASVLGNLLSTIMPITGVMNSIVEKAKSETVGLVSTEQVGLFKNTMVGMIQTNFVGKKSVLDVGEESIVKVGKKRLVEVGEELTVKVGKSLLVMKADGTIRLLGDNLNITMSGPVQINGSVIDLN